MEVVKIDDFEKGLSTLEQNVKNLAMLQTIEGFESKGWALYEAPESVNGLDDLKQIIEQGYENQELKEGSRYIPLPLVRGNENDYRMVMCAINALKTPFGFVEFDQSSIPEKYQTASLSELVQNRVFPKINAVYPIDSVSFNGDLALVVDKRGMNNQALARIPSSIEEPALIVPYQDIASALQFQVNQYRAKQPVNQVNKDGNYNIH